jgi:hypothetical protein
MQQLKGMMMQSLERRIAELEANASAKASNLTVVQIFPKYGETDDDAIKRTGYDPVTPNSMFICFVAL